MYTILVTVQQTMMAEMLVDGGTEVALTYIPTINTNINGQ